MDAVGRSGGDVEHESQGLRGSRDWKPQVLTALGRLVGVMEALVQNESESRSS